ncbi:MAG: hypothetical protein K2I78_04250, partial [Clostridia bacterium]|nr:hypothetical protein [Clostridia bacterium]
FPDRIQNGVEMDIRKKKLSINLAIVTAVLMALVFSCVGVVFGTNKTTQAIISSNIDSESTNLGEMLLEGYENDTTGKSKVFDGEVFWELIKQITGEENPTKSTLDNLTMPKTSAEFRTFNGGTKDVVVQIGGKKWIATYLSTNTSGEPILTLWLADSSTRVRWNEKVSEPLGKYPSNMYGTSEMRAKTLNNGGGYAVNYNDSSLTPVNQDENSEWAIYTMDSVKGSLTSFIEVPNNMSWQHDQKALDYVTSSEYKSGYGYNNNNDALDIGCNYSSKYNYLTNTTVDTDGYKGWANDTLWLPSIAETGVHGAEGIWKADNSTRASDNEYVWLRSAAYYCYSVTYSISLGGNYMSGDYANNAGYVLRPAFHLNLKAAADRAGVLGVA